MIILRKARVQESLVPATPTELKLLKAQAETDLKISKQVLSPMKDVDQYLFLYTPGTWQENLSIYEALELTVQHSNYQVRLIKAGISFTGFLMYDDSNGIIKHIKMGSFFDDTKKANRMLAIDLINFIDQNMKNHARIEWQAEIDNPANKKFYQTLIPNRFSQYHFDYVYSKKVKRFVYWVDKVFPNVQLKLGREVNW